MFLSLTKLKEKFECIKKHSSNNIFSVNKLHEKCGYARYSSLSSYVINPLTKMGIIKKTAEKGIYKIIKSDFEVVVSCVFLTDKKFFCKRCSRVLKLEKHDKKSAIEIDNMFSSMQKYYNIGEKLKAVDMKPVEIILYEKECKCGYKNTLFLAFDKKVYLDVFDNFDDAIKRIKKENNKKYRFIRMFEDPPKFVSY